MKAWIVALFAVSVVFGFIAALLYGTDVQRKEFDDQCYWKGGVTIESRNGRFFCIKSEAVLL